jgi:hypothetical protein
MTLHDFIMNNRVEVTMDEKGIYNCYINYKEGDKPYGKSKSNCLEAIDAGVMNYMQFHNLQRNAQPVQQSAADELRKFLTTEALFIWYFYARKYNITKIVNHYENLAQDTHPEYLNAIRFMYDTVNKAIDNPQLEIMKDYAAINNVFIQALVYYESLKIEKYETNSVINKLVKNLSAEDQDAFYKVQKTVELIDSEIQTITNG